MAHSCRSGVRASRPGRRFDRSDCLGKFLFDVFVRREEAWLVMQNSHERNSYAEKANQVSIQPFRHGDTNHRGKTQDVCLLLVVVAGL